MANRASRRGFTNTAQLRRHEDFLREVWRARNPARTARRGTLSQLRGLLNALCSVIFAEIPPDANTREHVIRHPRIRRFLEKFTPPIARRLLASREPRAYLDFLKRLSTALRPILSNLFSPCRARVADSPPTAPPP